MKTLNITLYSFDELSDKAKAIAISKFKPETEFIWEDGRATSEAFTKIFGLETSCRSWLELSFNRTHPDILNLSGLRLRKYLINNHYYDIFKPKTFYNNNYTKSRLSKIFKKSECPLTGIYTDDKILQPIYDFLSWKSHNPHGETFETLFSSCIESLKIALEQEEEYQRSFTTVANNLSEDKEPIYLSNGLKIFNN
jgi:hypothetical protein